MRINRRLAALFLSLLCLLSAARAQTATDESGAQILRDPENGLWSYTSEALTITITRRQDDTPRIWYETEVLASAAQPLRACVTPGKRPARKLVNPRKLAVENRLVLAITDDFCSYRLQKGIKPGVVIREGVTLGDKTRSSRSSRAWPNLDTLAVFPDGSMRAYVSDAYKAADYLEMGAVNVFAFGPVLLSGGEIPEYILQSDYYPYNEPRMAIGMIEPYHYIILTVEGREKASVGARVGWMAERLQALGCTEALNLDGGGTAVLMFMGEVLNRSTKNMRSIGSLIGFGTSELVGME